LRIFSVLWAIGALFHLGKWSLWADTPASLALTVAATFVILRPGDMLPLAALFGAQVWALALDMPRTSNHLVLSGLVGMLGLLAIATQMARRGRLGAVPFHRDFAPPARAILLLVLFFAAFHKLNADWFDLEVSCGGELWATIAARVPGAPDGDWARWAAIVGGISIELAAPALLLTRRLRVLGLALAWAFLFMVGIAGFFNFAAIVGALLFLFAPANLLELLAAARRRWPALERVATAARSGPVRRALRLAPAIVAGTAIFVALSRPWAGRVAEPILVREIESGTRPTISYAFEVAWVALALGAAAGIALAVRAGRSWWPTARRLLAHPAPALAVVPLMTLLVAVGPYFGLRSETSFAMFSNLRTEEGSNHLLVRHPPDVLGMQGDLVRIVSSSDPELRRVAERGYLLPWLELQEYVRARARVTGADFAVSYVRDGRRRDVERAGHDAELLRPAPFVVRELVSFRPIWTGDRNPCRH
jgi:hypothetical protein